MSAVPIWAWIAVVGFALGFVLLIVLLGRAEKRQFEERRRLVLTALEGRGFEPEDGKPTGRIPWLGRAVLPIAKGARSLARRGDLTVVDAVSRGPAVLGCNSERSSSDQPRAPWRRHTTVVVEGLPGSGGGLASDQGSIYLVPNQAAQLDTALSRHDGASFEAARRLAGAAARLDAPRGALKRQHPAFADRVVIGATRDDERLHFRARFLCDVLANLLAEEPDLILEVSAGGVLVSQRVPPGDRRGVESVLEAGLLAPHEIARLVGVAERVAEQLMLRAAA